MQQCEAAALLAEARGRISLMVGSIERHLAAPDGDVQPLIEIALRAGRWLQQQHGETSREFSEALGRLEALSDRLTVEARATVAGGRLR